MWIMSKFKISALECAICLIILQFGSSSAQDGRTDAEELYFPVESNVAVNSSVLSLPRIFPSGRNFTVTWINYVSPTRRTKEKTSAFKMDARTMTLQTAENLRPFLGGYFELRITSVSSDNGIQTAEKIRIFVVDKSYRLQLVVKRKPEVIESDKLALMRDLKQATTKDELQLIFVIEKFRFSTFTTGQIDFSQGELCFYALEQTGIPIAALQVLPKLRRNFGPGIQSFYDKNNIQKISECADNTSGVFKLDNLGVGLLILAIILSITLVGAIIFVVCWLRMRRLHAAVISTSNMHQPPNLIPPGFHAPKPMSIVSGPWAGPPYPMGMYDFQMKRAAPQSSCEAQYEWQESTLDLGDGDSVSRRPVSSSSSAPSLPEDCESPTSYSPEITPL